MKFDYQYRTRDNKPCRGVIRAATKDAAYADLRAQGIKPVRVEPSSGLLNLLLGRGKRWIAITVLFVVAAVCGAVLFRKGREARAARYASDFRGQIYGDASVLQAYDATAWADVFADAGDRLLAAFAQPGKPPSEAASSVTNSFAALNIVPVAIEPRDADEVKRMKRIVNGMKLELSEYLKAGGNFKGYAERLVERQATEQRILTYLTNDIESLRRQAERVDRRTELMSAWRNKNATLRNMGFKTIPLPEDWEFDEAESGRNRAESVGDKFFKNLRKGP